MNIQTCPKCSKKTFEKMVTKEGNKNIIVRPVGTNFVAAERKLAGSMLLIKTIF